MLIILKRFQREIPRGNADLETISSLNPTYLLALVPPD